MNTEKFSKANITVWSGFAITLIGALSFYLQLSPAMGLFDPRRPSLYILFVGLDLSIIGFGLEMRHGSIHWRRSLAFPLFLGSLALAGFYLANTYLVFKEEEVRFSNGDVVLAGTLMIPHGEGPFPAVVFMHGAGEETRNRTRVEGRAMIRKGIAALVYDKRGTGSSIGGHYRFDGYEALARDAIAGLEYLQGRPEIDADRIGVYGISEGGWTASLAAALSDDVAFLIAVSGAAATPEEQGSYEIEYRLKNNGFSEEEVQKAVTIYRRVNQYYRTGQGRSEVEAALQEVQYEEWFQAALDLPVTLPPYDALSPLQVWWRSHMDFDALPLIEALGIPMLFIIGENDSLSPPELNAQKLDQALNAAGHSDFTIRVYPNAGHGMVAVPADCSLCIPSDEIGPMLPWFVPGYLEVISDWVAQRFGTAS